MARVSLRDGKEWGMAIGRQPSQVRFEDPVGLLGDRLKGIYRLLAEDGAVLFGDDYFADLYTRSRKGRPTIPARWQCSLPIGKAAPMICTNCTTRRSRNTKRC